MKKIIVTARKENVDKIMPIIQDKIYNVDERQNIFKFEIYTWDQYLDDLLHQLYEAIDLRYKESLIEVYSPEFIVSPSLEREERKAKKQKEHVPVEKVLSSTRPLVHLRVSDLSLASIAGLIALMGLFLNNVAVIIGAMLLSPLLGPIYSFAIHTAIGKSSEAYRSLLNVLILLCCVIGLAYLVTLGISSFWELAPTPEIMSRFETHPIYMLMAILLGMASIMALSRGISEGMAGVSIAAALLPPAVVAGVSLHLFPSKSVNALLLTLENVIGLMAGGLLATLIMRIGPRQYYRQIQAKKFFVRIGATFMLLLVILLVLTFFVAETGKNKIPAAPEPRRRLPSVRQCRNSKHPSILSVYTIYPAAS